MYIAPIKPGLALYSLFNAFAYRHAARQPRQCVIALWGYLAAASRKTLVLALKTPHFTKTTFAKKITTFAKKNLSRTGAPCLRRLPHIQVHEAAALLQTGSVASCVQDAGDCLCREAHKPA